MTGVGKVTGFNCSIRYFISLYLIYNIIYFFFWFIFFHLFKLCRKNSIVVLRKHVEGLNSASFSPSVIFLISPLHSPLPSPLPFLISFPLTYSLLIITYTAYITHSSSSSFFLIQYPSHFFFHSSSSAS